MVAHMTRKRPRTGVTKTKKKRIVTEAKLKLKTPKLGTALMFKRYVDAHGWVGGIKLMKAKGNTGIKF